MNEDRFENNNSQDTAYNLGIITEDILEEDLLILDASQDWFKFSVDPFNVESLQISLEFENNLGDLDLRVIDPSENNFFSTGSNDTESLSFNTINPGDYFIQVYGEASPNYSLNIDVSLREFDETITLDIDTTSDQNDGSSDNGLSLRDAILIANNNPNNEYLINLQPGETYSLNKEGINEDFGLTGDLDVRGNLTIRTVGEDSNPAIIDASNLIQRDRVFEVRSYFTDFPELIIEDYIIDGQEIFSANLNLENIVIAGGRTEEDANNNPSGGGIFASKRSFLNIANSTITNNGIVLGNTRRVGSALYSSGITTIVNSQIANNYIEQKPVSSGIGTPGAPYTVYHQGPKLTVVDSQIKQNNDGGIQTITDFRDQDAVTEAEIINSTINDNQGEGISANATETKIIDSTISNNSLSGISTFSGTSIINSTISNNGASDSVRSFRGGQNPGILIRGEDNLIENSTITNNFNQGIATFSVINGTFSFSVKNSTIAYNQNGGIEINNVSGSRTTATISDSIIANNTIAYESAGGLYVQDNNSPQINLENTVIANNQEGDVSGPLQGNSFNLIGNIEDTSGSLGTGTDIVDSNLNVRLAPLGNYGGATETHALYGIDIAGEELDISMFEETIPFLSSDDTNTIDDDDLNFSPDILDTNINRFQNEDIPGTYLYAGETESQVIRESFPNFVEEGLAFKVATEPGDNLIPLYRFQSLGTPGTYLYAGEAERQIVNQDFSDSFKEEGLAFYVYGVGAGIGTEFTRFQNSDRSGTYLYAAGAEADSIRENFPNFIEEGAAFEVGT